MTNEEIYKYADKKFGSKRENIAITKFLFGIFGFVLMYSPVLMLGDNWNCKNGVMDLIISLVAVACLFIAYIKSAFEIKKEWRNFSYNLVRKDERNRCMTKIEQYEHEGSK